MVKFNIIDDVLTDHSCYMIKSQLCDRVYVGYTIDFKHRIRQHNGEITGGAKKTSKHRPWEPICIIKGFLDKSSALRFEWKLQHIKIRLDRRKSNVQHYIERLNYLILHGDGSKRKDNIMPWPKLYIKWYHNYRIDNPNVVNLNFYR